MTINSRNMKEEYEMNDLAKLLTEYPEDPCLNLIAGLFDRMDAGQIFDPRFPGNDPFMKIITEALSLIDEQKSLERRCPELPNLKLVMENYTKDIMDLLYKAADLSDDLQVMYTEKEIAFNRQLLVELEHKQAEGERQIAELEHQMASNIQKMASDNQKIIELLEASKAIMESRKPDKLGATISMEF
jgi:hypothetical protein